jgi:hypothetical protein
MNTYRKSISKPCRVISYRKTGRGIPGCTGPQTTKDHFQRPKHNQHDAATPGVVGLANPQCLIANLYFVYLSTQSRNVLYQNFAFRGFITQCPSSGNTTSFEGTPCRCSALKNSSDCVYGTR